MGCGGNLYCSSEDRWLASLVYQYQPTSRPRPLPGRPVRSEWGRKSKRDGSDQCRTMIATVVITAQSITPKLIVTSRTRSSNAASNSWRNLAASSRNNKGEATDRSQTVTADGFVPFIKIRSDIITFLPTARSGHSGISQAFDRIESIRLFMAWSTPGHGRSGKFTPLALRHEPASIQATTGEAARSSHLRE
jgi:hypothetical protein